MKTMESLTNEAKLIRVYGQGKWSTCVLNNQLYLLTTTKITQHNTIAIIKVNNECTIYNRDMVNLFVDWSHENFKNSIPTDKLSEQKVKEYLITYLKDDVREILTFSKNKEALTNVINQFSDELKPKIHKGLIDLGVEFNNEFTPYTQAYTKFQIEDFFNRKYYYICFDVANQKYEMTNNNDFSKVFKNGSCGSRNKLENDKNCYVFFFKKADVSIIQDNDLHRAIQKDLIKNPYEAVEKFIEYENRLTKALDGTIQDIAEIQGSCELVNVYYPNIQYYTEEIVKTIRNYQKSNSDIEKATCTSDLRNYYQGIYAELQKSQDSLKKMNDKRNEVRNV